MPRKKQRYTNSKDIKFLRIYFPVGVSKISIKTGKGKSEESDCDAFLKICDVNNNCCKTTSNSGGLADPYKNDREKDETDMYTENALLNTCSEVFYF